MSRSARVTRFFGGEDRVFALRIGEAEELQETFDCGLLPLATRVAAVDVRAVREVLRLGLIGGGMEGPGERERAARLVRRHLVPGELVAAADVALAAINAACRGAEDERLGEPAGETATTTLSPEGSSDTATSTASEASSAGAPTPSAAPPSGSSARP